MIFIVRNAMRGDVRVVHTRRPVSSETRDFFCVGEERELERLRDEGCTIALLHDGWYPDERGGGVAVWGNGRYWEVRSTPFDVVDSG